MFERRVIAPDDIGRFPGNPLNTAASEHIAPFRVESVSAAGDGPGLVDQTRSGTAIEQWANHRPSRAGGITNALPDGVGGIGRQRANRVSDEPPFLPRNSRRGGQMPAAVVTSFPARPISMHRRDRLGAQPNIVLDLVERRHETDLFSNTHLRERQLPLVKNSTSIMLGAWMMLGSTGIFLKLNRRHADTFSGV